ncbi:MAG: RNA-guided endonuclease InsQ/TnpB family protein [Xenococcus sp. (in: cyanobacteria)]
MYGCQQQLIHANDDIKAVLEFICSEANKLTNCAIYYCRQMFFKAYKYISNYELDEIMKSNLHFKALRSAVAQQACHKVGESFKSYRKLAKLYREGKLTDKPKLPKYRKKGGLTVVSYPARWLKLIDNRDESGTSRSKLGVSSRRIKFTLGNQVKAWFKIDSFTLPMPSNLSFKDIKEIRILPRNRCFYAEFVYKQKKIKSNLNQSNVLGIDPGLGNLLTCVSTTGKSFIVDGKKIKSINQWYNKKVAARKKGKPQAYWDNELAALSEKRNRQFRDIRNKVARFIINWCLANNVGTIIFGWNKGIKNGSKMRKKENQEFVTVPHAAIKNRIEQLASQYGIIFIEQEESYTSKSNFLANDELPTFGEEVASSEKTSEACDDRKSEREHKFTGKRGTRIKGKLNNLGRGGYLTNDRIWLNSDCNGAANIIRKGLRSLARSAFPCGDPSGGNGGLDKSGASAQRLPSGLPSGFPRLGNAHQETGLTSDTNLSISESPHPGASQVKIPRVPTACKGAGSDLKVMTQLKNISLAKVTRDVLSRPHRYDVLKDLSKSYRIRCEEAHEAC